MRELCEDRLQESPVETEDPWDEEAALTIRDQLPDATDHDEPHLTDDDRCRRCATEGPHSVTLRGP